MNCPITLSDWSDIGPPAFAFPLLKNMDSREIARKLRQDLFLPFKTKPKKK